MRVGLFGGAFNPPHVGHVMAAAYAQSVGDFTWIWAIPCWEHAFSKNSGLIEFEHRLKMTRLAFEGQKWTKVPEFSND